MFVSHAVPGGGLHLAFTARAGGRSAPPYDGLNLGDHVGDDPASVAANRADVAAAAGVAPERLLFARQVHGADVVVADGPWVGPPPAADALVTRTPGLVLGLLVADCVPVLLTAPDDGIVAVAHAGRAGLVAGVVPAVIAVMRSVGADRITGTIGPSVCGACYEVPAELAASVTAFVLAAESTTRRGTTGLDIGAGVLAQAHADGVTLERVGGCTVEDRALYSYRRDGVTGRFAGLAWIAA